MLDLRLLVRTAQRLHQLYGDRSVTAVHEALQICFSKLPSRVNELCSSVSALAKNGTPVPIGLWHRHAAALNRQFRTAVDEASAQLQSCRQANSRLALLH